MLKRNFEGYLRADPDAYGLHQETESDAGGFDIRKIISIARRRFWIVVGCAIIGTLLAFIYALQQTDIYRASATIIIDPKRPNIVNAEAVVAGLSQDWYAIESELEIIRSTAVARRVVNRLDLAAAGDAGDTNSGSSPIGQLISGLFSGEPEPVDTIPDPDTKAQGIARSLSKSVSTSRIADTYLIQISYSSPNPQYAAQIANAFADEYLVDQLESRFEATRRANEWLDARVSELRNQVRSAERAVEIFRAENDMQIANGATLGDQQIAKLNEQIILARAETAQAKVKLDQVKDIMARGGDVTSFAEGLQSSAISALRAQLSGAQRENAELSSKYGGRHPAVIKIRANIGDIRRQFANEVGRIQSAAETQYEVALSREASIEQSLAEFTGATADSQAAVQVRELEREAQATRALYESFLARFKEVTVQETLQTADSRIIERAITPSYPSAPNRPSLIVMGLVMSLALGGGLAFLLEMLDNGYRTAMQLESDIGVPVIASLPCVKLKETRVAPKILKVMSRLNWIPFSSQLRAQSTTADSRSRSLMARYVLEKPLSPFTEAIRALRMGIRYGDIDNPTRVVMITSAIPGEAKSVTAANLALHAAAAGEKVLLIDTDLRHPALTKSISPDAEFGIVHAITGEAKPSACVRSIAQLKFIPAIVLPTVLHTAEILGSQKMKDFLYSVREIFDLVIIDSSPLLPVTDGRALIEAVDGVVLCVKWESTGRDAVKSALRQSHGLSDKLIGCVLSQVDTEKSRYYDYYNSGYYTKEYPYYYGANSA